MSASTSRDFADGARFLKAALQVNPFGYLKKQQKKTPFKDEESYSSAIVQSCLKNGIEMIAVTDHFAIEESFTLIRQASDAGLIAFPGFEAVTSEGIHMLCLFDPATGKRTIERCIGACGVCGTEDEKSPGAKSFAELLDLVASWDAVALAPHVTGSGGLLEVLEGEPRQRAWTNEKLIAAAIAIPIGKLDRGRAQMIRGKLKGYTRDHPVSLIYAADVSDPDQLSAETSWSWIKVSGSTIDSLRHGFLDPDSRVRLPGSFEEPPRRRILAVTWTGGFFDGVTIHFNSALNVLVGPRGSGKSTVLESIRFVLGAETLGADAKGAHEGFVSEVLQPGTEVALRVSSDAGDGVWTISRAVSGGDAVVVGPAGSVSGMKPVDLLGPVGVFGQHEIAELARLPARRSRLLDRFVPPSPPPPRARETVQRDLVENRERVAKAERDRAVLVKELERLPAVEARLDAYREAGVEKKLEREAGYRRENPLVGQALDLLEAFEAELDQFEPLDVTFLADESIDDLPSRADLVAMRKALKKLDDAITLDLKALRTAAEEARSAVESAVERRDQRREKEAKDYLAKLRDLQADSIDGESYLKLEEEHATLERLKEKLDPLLKRASDLQQARQKLLDEWYGLQDREHEQLKTAARLVTRALGPTVRVVTALRGDRSELVDFIRSHVSGQLHNVERAVRTAEEVSPREFAEACRHGSDALKAFLGIGGKQVENTAQLTPAELLELEEIWLDPTTSIELRVGEDSEGKPIWRGLGHLSTGQKATAILLLLLLNSPDSAPLVVDQPEDDLDNSFIADDVVPRLRADKHSRQFLLSTHNPNIPVLGDAEQVIRLTADGEAGAGGRAFVAKGHMGSLDQATIRVELEALEGGRRAFETRRRRYGY